jgi:CRISPR-associated protein Cas2
MWMVCYDVTDDRRRQAVARALSALGERVQYSVFECDFTPEEAHRVLGRLAEQLDPASDSLRAYPLCRWCSPRAAGFLSGSRIHAGSGERVRVL